jgi:hypothetical protein
MVVLYVATTMRFLELGITPHKIAGVAIEQHFVCLLTVQVVRPEWKELVERKACRKGPIQSHGIRLQMHSGGALLSLFASVLLCLGELAY